MAAPASRLQVAALMGAAALGLHEARYLLGGSGHTPGHEGNGHAYLVLLAPALAALCSLGLALFVRRLALAPSEGGDRPAKPALARVWLAATAGLLAVYVGQEWLEGTLAGHAGGLHAVFGHGGWAAALVLAPLFGALVALVLRGARALVAAVRGRRSSAGRLHAPLVQPPRLPDVLPPASVEARHLASRGPPSAPLSIQ